MIDIEKTRAEIERLKEKAHNAVTPEMLKHKVHYYLGREDVCKELLKFMDSIQTKTESLA